MSFVFSAKEPKEKDIGEYLDGSHLTWVQKDAGINRLSLEHPYEILRYCKSAPRRHGYASIGAVDKFASAVESRYESLGFPQLAARFGELVRICGCAPGSVESWLRQDLDRSSPGCSEEEIRELLRLNLSFFFEFFKPHAKEDRTFMLRWCGVFQEMIEAKLALDLDSVLACLSEDERSFWNRGVDLFRQETQNGRISEATLSIAERAGLFGTDVSWSLTSGSTVIASGISSTADWALSDAQRSLRCPTLAKRLAPGFVLRTQ